MQGIKGYHETYHSNAVACFHQINGNYYGSYVLILDNMTS